MAEQDRATIVQWRDRTGGRLLDAGCGPGHWTEVLSEGGRRGVVGIDGSTRFLEAARDRFPGNRFLNADLSALPFASRSLGGVLAWYSVIHAQHAELPQILDWKSIVYGPRVSVSVDPGGRRINKQQKTTIL